ncbi:MULTISPECIES: Spy0128 family protein [Collinsella]|uniref:Spy0128 family protein n=1 Tax=Collinsella TaxID=102106 RepID=UPI000B7E6529|nr:MULTISPECIES: FctA domain-containing protein [Collinsella]MBX9027292.1 VWA domain-containing protein [Collinsella aerofaciens]RGL39847.1 VWA domain-containing protein [Collinsella sp. TF06-6AC]
MSKYTRGLLAVILAVVLVLPAAAFAMLPEANARSSTGMDGPTASKKIVDPDTTGRWQYWASGGEQDQTTRYVGRIWTDKTVEPAEDEKSDFVTTLSTMSSTSDTTSLVTKPLDIVMVLDASGSMDESMGGNDQTKRITALKNAASSFIDAIAEQNAKIDASKQHQVAIVKFAGSRADWVGNDTYWESGYRYNYSQTMKKLTPCTGDDATSLKSTVNSISPNGATRADYGLQLADGVFSSGRADAKKIVVFFADGSPTSSSGFQASVADSAVKSAKSLKNKGADIYTIGIFNGANPVADPTNYWTSNENKFMHAVSSNYPNATSYTTNELGKRTENSDFYKAASNADELKKVFDDISSSITSGKGSPTQIEDGYDESKSGYITFSDELGDFMQVDTFVSAQINGVPFDEVTKTTKGNTDTYEFSGVAKDLVITVERSANAQQGDIVTVKIPASLIPLIRYHVDMENGIFERTSLNDIKPIQIKYTSSVKDAARNNLFTPDDGLKKYIEKHKGADNQTVYFLANKYSGGELGDVVAEFEPADTNSYYYFQKITPIYTDKECTQRATVKPQGNDVYYYKDEFVAMGANGKPKDDYAVVEFEGHEIASYDGALVKDDGYWSFNKGTARLAYIDQLHTTKDDVEANGNKTETARDVLNPRWNDLSSVATSTHVHSHLGNNGKIIFSLATKPTAVDTKTDFGLTKVLEGRKWADTDAFEFELSATSDNNAPMPDPATVTVTNADLDKGKAAINFGKITYAEPGEYTYEVREVKGDAGGITYSKNVATFKVTVTVNAKGELKADVEKISGETEFKNTYSVKPVEDQITATKVLTGRDLKEGEFSFELVEGNKVVAKGTNAADGTIAMDKITYDKPGNHTYTLREKLPNEAGLSNGITYDKTNYTIKTSVIDNGDGTLKVTHALEGTKPARFENKYNTAPNKSSVTDQITATKTLTGRDLKEGEFSFELVEGNKVVARGTNAADGKITMDKITYTAAGEHTYMLRETKVDADNGITYSTAAYTIVTTVTDDGNGKLTVKHELQDVEKAIFENAYSVTPVNSSVTDQITATKFLTGRDMTAGEFSFELVEDGKVVATGKNDADGKIVMDKITYDKAGEHTYILREAKGAEGNGIAYDDKTYTVVTTITDNGKGKLVAKHELKDAKTAEFENSYKPNPGEFSVTDQITATKVLTGRDLKDGEFSFQLVEGDKVVATGKNAADGTITMSPVKYEKAGTHTYTLREVNGGTTSKGITYSDAKFTIETTITDNGDGTLSAQHVLKNAEAAIFKNTYSVTPLDTELDFGLSKAIDGRDWTDADKFSFTISAAEGTDAPLPDPATVTVSKKDAKDGIAAINFGEIRYTAAGTYKYEIRENAGNAAGMTYDGHVATAEVTVTDNGKGVLTANVTKKESGRFTNTYRTELDYAAAGGLKLSKTLSGRPMTEGQFSFTVTPADEASAGALGLLPGANTFKSPATAEATVGLIDILAGHEVKFKQADAGKTFKYTVAEKNDGKPGYTYDDAARTVTIAIADDGAGTLTATTTVSGGPEGTHETIYKSGENKVESAVVPFKNSYSALTDKPAQIVATKTLTGRPMVDGEFYFGIAYAGETEAIEGTCVTNVNGQVSFGALHYTTEMLADLVSAKRAIRTDTDAKLAWTINYTAFEYTSPLAAKGITAATPSFSFKVIVVDNGDGTLTATPAYDGIQPLFENVYGAEAADAALAGTKKLQAAEGLTPADITGKFTFTVTADEAGAPMPERTIATNDAAGNVDFGKIHFTLEDLNRALGVTDDATDKAEADEADEAEADEAEAEEADADADANADEPSDESEPAAPIAPRSHTFTYTVTESGSAPGVTNDANTARKVSYTVTDDRAGHLSVVRNGDDGAAFTFTNTYSVTPTDSSVTDQVKTVKRLTGRDLAAGEFTFDLLEDGVTVASGTNDASGNVTLSPIRYEAPGTHTYTLREACPNALGLYKGVTYDGTTYTVVTTVSDNGDGTLTATHKLEGTTESAGFTNKYHAMPTQVSIGAIKVLEGRELKKDEFSFKLVGEDIESTVTNDADGKINFDKFEYDAPGAYVYTISEVKGDEAGMTYDKSVFTATVNVVDDGEGNLKASVAFTKGDKSVEGIVFNNMYKKPETPKPAPDPGTPKTVTNIVKTVTRYLPTTGDQQAAALLMAFVIAMTGVGALVWGIRKR